MTAHPPVSPRPARGTDEIVAALRDRILDGRLAPGARLIETGLAREFAVGRSRIREAFRVLAGEGHLETLANRGVTVRRYGRRDLLDMGRAREVLESLAARLAAERGLDPAQRYTLRAAQDRMDAAEAAGDLEAYSRGNRAYHATIEAMAGNAHVADLIERVRIPYLGLRLPHLFTVEQLRQSNEGHRFVTYAILAGAPEVAEAAMRSHIRAGNDHFAALPDGAFD